MNKAILMSIQPQWLAKILNGEKTIEIRKKFPKDYVGWVYIYCTKGKEMLFKAKLNINNKVVYHLWDKINNEGYRCYDETELNGKVVARFWCDKVEAFNFYESDENGNYTSVAYECDNENLGILELEKKSCVDYDDILDYIGLNKGYAIHISKLEVFEKPKQLDWFGHKNCKTCIANNGCSKVKKIVDSCGGLPLEKAPQSWCYIEGE